MIFLLPPTIYRGGCTLSTNWRFPDGGHRVEYMEDKKKPRRLDNSSNWDEAIAAK